MLSLYSSCHNLDPEELKIQVSMYDSKNNREDNDHDHNENNINHNNDLTRKINNSIKETAPYYKFKTPSLLHILFVIARSDTHGGRLSQSDSE
mmetsp:Transcript_7548/g.7448  ORF Transcript_7548/g.7448 Transcript_7548/m.7448 type:complete len:93 (-) Transcript_7548:19-297(-)